MRILGAILAVFISIGAAHAQFNNCAAGFCAPLIPAQLECSEADTFLARTAGLDAAHISIYKNLICGSDGDGVWSAYLAFYFLATQDSTTSLLNLRSTSFALTPTGTPNPDFVADRGWDVILTRTLIAAIANTDLNPASISLGLWMSSTGVLNGGAFGDAGKVAVGVSAGGINGRVFDFGSDAFAGAGLGALATSNRSGANAKQYYFGGNLLGTAATAQAAHTFTQFNINGISGSATFKTRFSVAFVTTRVLTAAEQVLVQARIRTALVALGAN